MLLAPLAAMQVAQPYLNAIAYANDRAQEAKEIAVELNVPIGNETLETLQQVLDLLPPRHLQVIKTIAIERQDKSVPRGRSNGPKVEFNLTQIEDQGEFASVAIHEFCHSIDFESLVGRSPRGSDFMDYNGPFPADDPSVRFYRISWLANDTKITDRPEDFVSIYSMTNVFEDFAETCHVYMSHAEKYADKATQNEIIQEKLAFMRNFVFDGRTYENPDENGIPHAYDSTQTPIAFNKFYERNKDAWPEDRAMQTAQLKITRASRGVRRI